MKVLIALFSILINITLQVSKDAILKRIMSFEREPLPTPHFYIKTGPQAKFLNLENCRMNMGGEPTLYGNKYFEYIHHSINQTCNATILDFETKVPEGNDSHFCFSLIYKSIQVTVSHPAAISTFDFDSVVFSNNTLIAGFKRPELESQMDATFQSEFNKRVYMAMNNNASIDFNTIINLVQSPKMPFELEGINFVEFAFDPFNLELTDATDNEIIIENFVIRFDAKLSDGTEYQDSLLKFSEVRFSKITTQFGYAEIQNPSLPGDNAFVQTLARGFDNWFEDAKSDFYRHHDKKTTQQMMFLE
jgi:hypothetical protein